VPKNLNVLGYMKKNFIINGNFDVWQRGTSFDHSGAAAYFADRWTGRRGGNVAGVTFRRSTSTIDGNHVMAMVRNVGDTETGAVFFGQILETVNSVRAQGNYLTLSFTSQVGAGYSGGNLTVRIRFGGGVDESYDLGAGTFTTNEGGDTFTQVLTTSPIRYTFTTSVPVSTDVTQIAVAVQWTPTGTAVAADWVSLSRVQLEIGEQATEFEYRPIGEEIAACQRYFWKSYRPAAIIGSVADEGAIVWMSVGNSRSYAWANVFPPVQFRVPPTVTVYSPNTGTAGKIYNINNASDTNGVTIYYVSENKFAIAPSATETLAIGDRLMAQVTADAEL
jgi:hypothetical protein